MSKKSNRFSPEVRERAVRIVQDHRGEYQAKCAHPPKIGHFVKFNASERTWTPNGSLVALELNRSAMVGAQSATTAIVLRHDLHLSEMKRNL